jgi:hypothetical protein
VGLERTIAYFRELRLAMGQAEAPRSAAPAASL